MTRTPDADGRRTEITCAKCGAHLGHVFVGEEFTPKNTRHWRQFGFRFSSNPKRKPANSRPPEGSRRRKRRGPKPRFSPEAVSGAWSTCCPRCPRAEGRIGLHRRQDENPTYEQVCSHTTGHAEAVRVTFDPAKVSYEKLAKFFFEIHDPTQLDGQGPDLGDQYRSEIFYTTPAQQQTAEKLIGELRRRGYDVVTEVTPAGRFWPPKIITSSITSARVRFRTATPIPNGFSRPAAASAGREESRRVLQAGEDSMSDPV